VIVISILHDLCDVNLFDIYWTHATSLSFYVWQVGCFRLDVKKPEVLCGESIHEIRVDYTFGL
jgi:hypothetical protein